MKQVLKYLQPFLTLFILFALSNTVSAEKPNIILFYIDDMAWNASPIRMDDNMPNSTIDLVEMPNFEKVAAQGMRFSNAYASAMCVPARACVQTGMSSGRHQFTVESAVTKIYDERKKYAALPVIANGVRKPLPDTITTIPEALGPLGYKCAHYGKWHLASDPAVEGYEEHDGDTNNKPGTTLKDVKVLPPDLSNPKLMDEMTDRSIAFMQKQVKAEAPFYIQLSHYAQHEPRECYPSSRAKFQEHPLVVELNEGETDPSKISARKDAASWLGMAYDLDQTLGRLMKELSKLNITDNTYLIVTTDNGYRHFFADRPQPLHAHKWWLWQGALRVPMVVQGPGIKPGSLSTANVVNYDFLPTFVEWAGGDPTKLEDIDGISLAGLMEGEAPDQNFLNRSLYFHYPHYRNSVPHSTIIKGNYKVMYFYATPVLQPDENPIMLFDLASDPGETNNIAEKNPEKAQAMHKDLANYLTQVGARIPKENSANYDSELYKKDPKEYKRRTKYGFFSGIREKSEDELEKAPLN